MAKEELMLLEKEIDDLIYAKSEKANTVKKYKVKSEESSIEEVNSKTGTKHYYDGHRKRVRSKIKSGGLEAFHDYELLEFMLFGAYARKDTKPIAKELIGQFGSLSNVLLVTREELVSLGFSDAVATLLAGYREVIRRYLMEKSTPGSFLNSSEKAKEYVHALCFGQKLECVYCIFMDSKKRILKTEKIAEGGRDSVVIYTEELFRKISIMRAKYIVIGHNHPSGILTPSRDDLNLLYEISIGARAVRSYIYDAIITSDSETVSLAELGYIKNNSILGFESKYIELDGDMEEL